MSRFAKLRELQPKSLDAVGNSSRIRLPLRVNYSTIVLCYNDLKYFVR